MRTMATSRRCKAVWCDPDVMPSGVVVQVRLPNGDIFDGMKDIIVAAPGDSRSASLPPGAKTYVWDAFGNRVREVRPMGWLPKAGGAAMPRNHVGIDEVVARVFSGLRTMRAERVDVWPASFKSAWPATIRDFSDLLGHIDAEGRYIDLREYPPGVEAPEVPPREIYFPEPGEIDRACVPLGWWAWLASPAAAVPDRQGAVRPKLWSIEQAVVWDRSLAFIAGPGRGNAVVPPGWRDVGRWNRISTESARQVFEMAVRRMWWRANTETEGSRQGQGVSHA